MINTEQFYKDNYQRHLKSLEEKLNKNGIDIKIIQSHFELENFYQCYRFCIDYIFLNNYDKVYKYNTVINHYYGGIKSDLHIEDIVKNEFFYKFERGILEEFFKENIKGVDIEDLNIITIKDYEFYDMISDFKTHRIYNTTLFRDIKFSLNRDIETKKLIIEISAFNDLFKKYFIIDKYFNFNQFDCVYYIKGILKEQMKDYIENYDKYRNYYEIDNRLPKKEDKPKKINKI